MKNSIALIFIHITAIVFLVPFELNANEHHENVIHLNGDHGKYLPNNNIYYLLDPDHYLQLEDIQSNHKKNNFIQSHSSILNLGFTDDNCWIQFDLLYTGKQKKKWLLEVAYPHLDYIELYMVHKTGNVEFRRAGDRLPFHQRETNYRTFTFHIQLQPDEKVRLYIKVDTESTMQVPIVIWDPIEFAQHVIHTEFFLGIFFGSLVLIVIYNFFLYLSIQDTKIIYYIVTIVSYFFFQMTLTGYSYQFLWRNYPELAHKSLPISILITLICAVAFSKVLITKKRNHIYLNWVLWGMLISGAVTFPFLLSIKYSYAIQVSVLYTIISSIVLLILAMISYGKGNRSLRFYILGYLTLIAGILLLILKSFGILPSVFLTEYALHVGSILLIIQLSMTIVDIINIERSKNEQEQIKTLNSNQELLTIQNDLQSRQKMNSQTIEKDSQKLSTISDDLANNFSLMNTQSENVSVTSEEISVNVSNISGSINQIVESIDHILSESNELSKLIQSVSESIEDMSQAMEAIEINAHEGANVSKSAKLLSQKTFHTINDLKESAMEIGKVTELIKRISDKTNLLSSNAAIEAFSAGEAGKGFSVVADAINKFADRSSSAADDIFRIISDVQSRTKEAVHVIYDVTENIEQIHLSSGEMFTSIQHQIRTASTVESSVSISKHHAKVISEAFSHISDVANDISRLVNEIDQGTHDVAKNIRLVSSEINSSQEGIIQIKETSHALSLISKELSI